MTPEQKEKWEEEARNSWIKLSPHIPIGFGFDLYLKGYLQACKVRQEETEKLRKLGDRLCETSSHKLNCGFSSCTCGSVKEQAEALGNWNRERRQNE